MIRRKRDVWLLAAGVTLITNFVSLGTVMLVYPVSGWWINLPVTFGLTTSLSFAFTIVVARQGLKNFELAQELRRLLERDRLTDVATRDFFYQRMTEAPESYGLSLMVDIDHFKTVNDTYGHHAGDRIIRHVAQILQANCRANDIVCRFGGEEFVIFLFGVGQENGLDVAERIRHGIEQSLLAHEDLSIHVTVSIGGALKQRTDEIDAAIQEADAALYRAKELGRNRSIMSWLRPEEPKAEEAA